MFLPIIQGIAVLLTAISSFLIGMMFDFSGYVTWMLQDPSGGVSVISQSLDGDLSDYHKRSYFLHKTAIDAVQAMTDEQKVGQLLVPAWEKNMSRDEFISQAKKYHINSMMTLRNDVSRQDMDIVKQELQVAVSDGSGPVVLEPLVALDAEPSLLQYRLPAAGYGTSTSELDTIDKAHQSGQEIAKILKTQGCNLNFAPVYDSGINTTVIADRAFATSSQDVADRANAFAQASMRHGVIPTAKHFPGHGYAVGDTHKTLESISGDLNEIEQFRSAVKNRVPMMMVGHLVVQGGEYDTHNLPATLSATSTQLLREGLGFKGVTITDALTMGALKQFDDADEAAFDAGMDLLLMPRDIEKTYQSMLQRLQADDTFAQQVNESVYRIVRLKLVSQWANTK